LKLEELWDEKRVKEIGGAGGCWTGIKAECMVSMMNNGVKGTHPIGIRFTTPTKC